MSPRLETYEKIGTKPELVSPAKNVVVEVVNVDVVVEFTVVAALIVELLKIVVVVLKMSVDCDAVTVIVLVRMAFELTDVDDGVYVVFGVQVTTVTIGSQCTEATFVLVGT